MPSVTAAVVTIDVIDSLSGDVLLVHVPPNTDEDFSCGIKDRMSQEFPDKKILVLPDGGIELEFGNREYLTKIRDHIGRLLDEMGGAG